MLELVGKRFFEAMHPTEIIDIKRFRAFWENVHARNSGYLLGEFDEGQAKGLFGLVIQPALWSDGLIASEVIWYSEGKEGMKLLAAAEQIARQRGCKKLYLQHMAGNGRIGKIYKRKGYIADTVRFCKEL